MSIEEGDEVIGKDGKVYEVREIKNGKYHLPGAAATIRSDKGNIVKANAPLRVRVDTEQEARELVEMAEESGFTASNTALQWREGLGIEIEPKVPGVWLCHEADISFSDRRQQVEAYLEYHSEEETMSDLTHEPKHGDWSYECIHCGEQDVPITEDCPEHPDRQREEDDEQFHHSIARKTNSVGDEHFECMKCEKTFYDLDRAMKDGSCPDRQREDEHKYKQWVNEHGHTIKAPVPDEQCTDHPDRQREDDDDLTHGIKGTAGEIKLGTDTKRCDYCNQWVEADNWSEPCPARQPAEDDDPANQVDCPEDGCDVSMSSASRIRDHVRCQHSEDDDDLSDVLEEGREDYEEGRTTPHEDVFDSNDQPTEDDDDGEGDVKRRLAKEILSGDTSLVGAVTVNKLNLYEQAIREHCELSEPKQRYTDFDPEVAHRIGLLPCPFCGSKPTLDFDSDVFAIHCDCGRSQAVASRDEDGSDYQQIACAKWNDQQVELSEGVSCSTCGYDLTGEPDHHYHTCQNCSDTVCDGCVVRRDASTEVDPNRREILCQDCDGIYDLKQEIRELKDKGVCEWSKDGDTVHPECHEADYGIKINDIWNFCPGCKGEITTDEGGFEVGDVVRITTGDMEGQYELIIGYVNDDPYCYKVVDKKGETSHEFPNQNPEKYLEKVGTFAPDDDALEQVPEHISGELVIGELYSGDKHVYLDLANGEFEVPEIDGTEMVINQWGESKIVEVLERTGIVIDFHEIAEDESDE